MYARNGAWRSRPNTPTSRDESVSGFRGFVTVGSKLPDRGRLGVPGRPLPRHTLRLRDTDEALRDTVAEILRPIVPMARLDVEVHNIVARAGAAKQRQPAHRALADAIGEHETWLHARKAARAVVLELG